MTFTQSKPSRSEKVEEVLRQYKYVLQLAFDAAQLSAAPFPEEYLHALLGEESEMEDLKLQRLSPWPEGRMRPDQAMQELERVFRRDQQGKPFLVGMPGLPPSRYKGSSLSLIQPVSSEVPENEPIPRDENYWKAYHHTVDHYRQTYFSGRKRGHPRITTKRARQLLTLRYLQNLTYGQIAIAVGEPWDAAKQRKQSTERIRKQVGAAKRDFLDATQFLDRDEL